MVLQKLPSPEYYSRIMTQNIADN